MRRAGLLASACPAAPLRQAPRPIAGQFRCRAANPPRPGPGRRRARVPQAATSSEAESYGEMQPPRRDGLPVGEVQPDRSDRRAHARPRAVADLGLEERIVVPGVAGVDEYADAPVVTDPLRVLRAHHEQAPPGQDRVALL